MKRALNQTSNAHATPYRRLPAWTAALLVVGGMLLVAGCSDKGVVGSRVDDFTAYYNTFHNANAAFEEGVQQIEERNEPINSDVYLSLFLQPTAGGSQTQAFDKAIEKSADVLRKHPTSRWVDDALLLIGKSYYYKGNDVGAAQKFREVVELGSEKEGEARFWLARTLVASGQYERAADVLNASLADEQEKFGTWTDRMRLARAQLFVRQQRWSEAEVALEQGLEGDVPDDVAARGWYLLGQVRETRDEPLTAAEAYEEAADANPRYELSYAAKYAAVRTRGLHGDTDQAIKQLRGLERDDKNYEKRFELLLLRARLQRAQGRPDKARETLRELMYGRERPSGDVVGRAHYTLGVLYRDDYENFSKAAAHFDSASTSLRRPAPDDETRAQFTPAAIVNSGDLAQQFGTLAEKAEAVARLDSLLRLGRMPPQAFRAFVDSLRDERIQEMRAESESRQQQATASRFQSRGASFEGQRGQGGGFSQQEAAATQSSEAGFLFHQEPSRVQEGRQSFERTWGTRPRVDNWRRIEAVRGQQTANANRGRPAQEAATAEEVQQVSLDLSAVPRDSVSLADMEFERAMARYELANALFLSANRPDSAATWYRTILDQNTDHPVARRALYALAEVRYAQGQTELARDLYRQVLQQYPDSPFAVRARNRLEVAEAPAAADSTEILETAYQQAYQDWQAGRLDTALTQMTDLAGRHPQSGVAPRAMLASGLIYLQQLRADTTTARAEPLRRLLASAEPLVLPADTAAASEADPARGREAGDEVGLPEPPSDTTRREPQSPSVPTPRRITTPGDTSDTAGGRAAEQPDTQPQRPRRTAPEDSLNRRGTPPGESVRTAVAPSDSARRASARPDSAGLNSPQTPPATAHSAASDSARTGAGADPMQPVESLFHLLANGYGDTPQGERAKTMLQALSERRAAADTVRADSARADSVRGQPLPADSLRAGDPSTERRGGADRAGQEIPQRGVWALVVGPYGDVQAASRQVDSLRTATNDRYAIDVQTLGGETTQFQVLLGRFDTQREAAAARARLRDVLPENVELKRRE